MIINGFMVPHPPIAVDNVGKGEEHKCQATVDSYKRVAEEIAKIQPDLILLASPHALLYRDWFNVSCGQYAYGDFSRFGSVSGMKVNYDSEFVQVLQKLCTTDGFPCGTQYDQEPELDHGTMVPLYYVNQKYTDYKLVRISLSGYSLAMHYQLGMYIEKVCEMLSRKAVFIASGDLSHCQKGSSYGFHKEGPVYDEKIMKTMSSGNFGELLTYDPVFLDKAMECGHRSFTIMAGVFDGRSVACEQYSHEAPFGIGYGFVHVMATGTDENRHFLTSYQQAQKDKIQNHSEDAYVKLARQSVNSWVKDHKKWKDYEVIPEMKERSGVFVSLHEDGELRGCIGTIAPYYENIAEEIVNNAISACSRDPRFNPVTVDELPYLTIHVDVLGKTERIASKEDLEVKKYGVVCSTKDGRRGLLLPDLEGVDTVDQQIAIACQKGGIDTDADDVILERFEVVRHE